MRYILIILVFLSVGANAQMVIKAHPNYIPLGGFSGILDTYSGAAAAYSLRKLDKDYTGSAIRVRKDTTGQPEQDFGFVNNFVDTNSIKNFIGNSPNIGFIVKWYDQSGNGRDAEMTTAANQPIYFNPAGSNDLLGIQFQLRNVIATRLNVDLPLQDIATIISVNADGTQDNQSSIHKPILAGRDTNVYVDNSRGYGFGKLRESSNGFRFGGPSLGLETSNRILVSYTKTNLRELIFAINNSASYSLFKNSISQGTQTGTNRTSGFITRYQIGASENGTQSRFYTGRLSELIIYTLNQSANRTGIETNINNFYGIY